VGEKGERRVEAINWESDKEGEILGFDRERGDRGRWREGTD
jgi:hypothetical protein